MLASLLWAVGPVHFDEAKVPKQVHMWYDKPNGFFTTTDYSLGLRYAADNCLYSFS